MTKSTITRDELNEVIATYGKHHIAHRMANALLAAMNSEPVYQVFDPGDGRLVDIDDEEEMTRLRSIGGETLTLYTAPPLPASGVDVVYQLWSAGIGQWVECDKQRFDAHSKLTAQRRILYTAPPSTVVDIEPIAWFYESDKMPMFTRFKEKADRAREMGFDVVALYRHARQPVVPDDAKLRELFDSWFASDCSFDQSPEASEADNIAWRESYWYVWQRCRAAMLNGGKS